MNRAEKISKRKTRARNRRTKRMQKYVSKIQAVRGTGAPLCAIGRYGKGPWADINSPTGMYQICDYSGICQYPCNGDC